MSRLSTLPPLLCGGPISSPSSRILIVGDSWVGGRRFDAGLSDVLGASARIASMGFAGATVSEIGEHVERLVPEFIAALGGRADCAVLVAGTNNYLQQTPLAGFTSDLRQAANRLYFVAESVVIVETPTVQPVRTGALSHFKLALRIAMAGGRHRTIHSYRAAIPDGPWEILPYDGFIDHFDPADFHADGVHMLPEAYHRLGKYIAKVVAEQSGVARL